MLYLQEQKEILNRITQVCSGLFVLQVNVAHIIQLKSINQATNYMITKKTPFL